MGDHNKVIEIPWYKQKLILNEKSPVKETIKGDHNKVIEIPWHKQKLIPSEKSPVKEVVPWFKHPSDSETPWSKYLSVEKGENDKCNSRSGPVFVLRKSKLNKSHKRKHKHHKKYKHKSRSPKCVKHCKQSSTSVGCEIVRRRIHKSYRSRIAQEISNNLMQEKVLRARNESEDEDNMPSCSGSKISENLCLPRKSFNMSIDSHRSRSRARTKRSSERTPRRKTHRKPYRGPPPSLSDKENSEEVSNNSRQEKALGARNKYENQDPMPGCSGSKTPENLCLPRRLFGTPTDYVSHRSRRRARIERSSERSPSRKIQRKTYKSPPPSVSDKKNSEEISNNSGQEKVLGARNKYEVQDPMPSSSGSKTPENLCLPRILFTTPTDYDSHQSRSRARIERSSERMPSRKTKRKSYINPPPSVSDKENNEGISRNLKRKSCEYYEQPENALMTASHNDDEFMVHNGWKRRLYQTGSEASSKKSSKKMKKLTLKMKFLNLNG